jgi:signal transduction histidine kinase
MKTLLVLAKESGLAAAVRAALDPDRYRVVSQEEVWPAEDVLRDGAFDACLFDAEHVAIRPIRVLEKIRERMPQCPILVFTGTRQWEWEEEAYLLGIVHVLTKPVRAKLLNTLLDRLWLHPARGGRALASGPTARAEGRGTFPAVLPASSLTPPAQLRTLEVLRDFSAILSHSLDARALLEDFLNLLRRLLGINRAAIFLRSPPRTLTEVLYSAEDRSLRAACATGLRASLLEHFELSLEAGIGGFVHRHGRILVHGSLEAAGDPEVEKEFELLGVRVAIPILDREACIGVAVFDGRLTGEPISHEELALVFHLLEALGLAIRNGWLHDQLATSHGLMADVLHQLSSACIVVSRELTVLHANPAAKQFFPPREGRHLPLTFPDLPQALGAKVFEVLKTGVPQAPSKFQPPDKPGATYLVAVTPFTRRGASGPDAALLLVEDFTQIEHAQRLELEASRSRLTEATSRRLAHVIGNCLVPLSTHQQLLDAKWDDGEFRATLKSALDDGVRRLTRLSDQFYFLSGDTIGRQEPVRVDQLLKEAFNEAAIHYPEKNAELKGDFGQAVQLWGDRAALRRALAELILNALQANSLTPKVEVNTRSELDAQGREWVRIEIQDLGSGFTPEAVERGTEPFWGTKQNGLGLGLTVARKVIEAHEGELAVGPSERPGRVVVRLPLAPAAAPADARGQRRFNGHEEDEAPVGSDGREPAESAGLQGRRSERGKTGR